MNPRLIRSKWALLSIISALLLSLLAPASALAAETDSVFYGKKLESSLADSWSLDTEIDVSRLDLSGRDALRQSGTQVDNGFIVEQLDENAVNKLLKPQNYVPASDSQALITVIVELQTEPIAVYEAKLNKGLLKSSVNGRSLLKQEQNDFAKAAAKLNIVLGEQYTHAFNGYSLQIPADQVDRLLGLPGVKAVYPYVEYTVQPVPDDYYPAMDVSAPFIGSEALWDTGYTGEGVKIGVLDTGIDYNHPSLKDAYKGGYDFIDNDDDPMETLPDPSNVNAATSHGTHVAGTIGGRGNPDDPNGATGRVKGVAYESDIYAYRVLGPGGRGSNASVLAGIDQSVKDGMDIINLSLGSSANHQLDVTSIAINNAVVAGVVAVLANGNDGPNPFTVGSPAASELGISVANSTPPADAVLISADGFGPRIGDFLEYSPGLGDLNGNTYEVVSAGLGTVSEFAGISAAGKIAFISRGSISFVDKMANAKSAGAIAAIIYNNIDGSFSGTLGGPGEHIPTIALSLAEGNALKALIEQSGTLNLNLNTIVDMDRINDSSSRGPALPGLTIKPDIAAPGTGIVSAVPAYGGNYSNAYEPNTGTSMAAPHIAGAAALLLDKDEELSHYDIKGLLMNNAIQLKDRDGDRYSYMEQGAGRIDLNKISNAKAIALVEETTTAVEGGTEIEYLTGALSFGQLDGGATATKTVRVKNIGETSSQFNIQFNWFGNGPGSLTADSLAISVGVGEEEAFDVHLAIDEAAANGYYEGELVLNESGGQTLKLPLSVYVGEVQLPDAVSDIELSAPIFSPNGDRLQDTTSINFKVNLAVELISFEVFDAETLSWKGTIFAEEDIAPDSYTLNNWNGVVTTASGARLVDEGVYVIIPFAGTKAGQTPIASQSAAFVIDVNAPVSSLDVPAITVTGSAGTISGKIESDLLIDLAESYDVVGVAALYEQGGKVEEAEGVIEANGQFSIRVPIADGDNYFEIYVYDAAYNGYLVPAHIVEYDHSVNPEPPSSTAVRAVVSKEEITVGQSVNVSIDFGEVEDLYTAQFSLTYSSEFVKSAVWTSAALSDYLEDANPGSGLIVQEQVQDLGGGKLRSDYIVSLTGDIEGFNGSGALASYAFASKSEGSYSFELSNVRLLDSQAEDIVITEVSGDTITVKPIPPVTNYLITGQIDAEAFNSSVNYSEVWYSGADGTHKVVVEALNAAGDVVATGTVAADGTYSISVPNGVYQVRVSVPGHKKAVESVTVNNSNTALNVGPLTAGDVNGDGIVDLVDLQLTAKEYGKSKGSGWANAKASAADINRDHTVDLLDISFILHNFEW